MIIHPDGTWRCEAEYTVRRQGHDVFLFRQRSEGRVDVIKGLTMQSVEAGHGFPETPPVLMGHHGTDFLQTVLNSAWELGLRPAGYNDAREAIGATKAHLEDMRRLVFKS